MSFLGNGLIIYVESGNASSATKTYGKRTSVPGSGVGDGKSAVPSSRAFMKFVFLQMLPSLNEPANRNMTCTFM